MPTTASIVSAVAAVGGTAAAVEGAAQQRRLAGQAQDRQNRDVEVAQMNAQKEKDRQLGQAATVAASDTNRQRMAASDDTSNLKGGTLLTGYSSGSVPSGSGPKTLLGE